VPWRLIDSVAVKGKSKGVKIYTAKTRLSDAETEAWALHNGAMDRYYARDFKGAIDSFQKVQRILPQDDAVELMVNRCLDFLKDPPPQDWDGVEIMHEK